MSQRLLRPKARIKYLLRDRFQGDLAAGAVNGTSAEPGPGTRTVTDTENKLSISGGVLAVGKKATPQLGDPRLLYASPARAAGRALLCTFTRSGGVAAKSCQIGFSATDAGGLNRARLYPYGDTVFVVGDTGAVGIVDGPTYQLALVLQTTGYLFFIKGGIFSEWTLASINDTEATALSYVGIQGCDSLFTADDLRITDLPAPLNTLYGIVTQRLAGVRLSGDTYSHEADCVIEITATDLTGGFGLRFRKQDASNYWRVFVDADGSMQLIEKANGTDTVRGSAGAGSLANSKRLTIVADGQKIWVYGNYTLRIAYASAANARTATAGELLTYAGAVLTDLTAWPRRLSGQALAALNRV